jgi:hypothetical protein
MLIFPCKRLDQMPGATLAGEMLAVKATAIFTKYPGRRGGMEGLGGGGGGGAVDKFFVGV